MKNAKELYNRLKYQNNRKELSQADLLHLQKVLLNAYMDIQSVCEKNGITIMLGGGSCLGAVRHKGFIPWDDDFDCLMSREDFERFKGIFAEELGDKYSLNAPNLSDHSYRFPRVFIKNTKIFETLTDDEDDVWPICIDIFLLENIPSQKFFRYLRGTVASFMMLAASSIQNYQSSKTNKNLYWQDKEGRRFFIRRWVLGKMFSVRDLQAWMNSVDHCCQYHKKTALLGIPTGRKHYFGEILPYEAFYPITKTEFEGKTVNIPGGWDLYLTNLYHDYMTIPPEEKREKHFYAGIDFGEY